MVLLTFKCEVCGERAEYPANRRIRCCTKPSCKAEWQRRQQRAYEHDTRGRRNRRDYFARYRDEHPERKTQR
jgi:hypothetical protein